MDCGKCGAREAIVNGYCGRCGAPAAGTMCQYGHVMDPGWTECLVCKPAAGAGGRAVPGTKGRTVVEDPGASSGRRGFTAGAELLRRPIPGAKGLTEATPEGGRKARTVYEAGAPGGAPAPGASPQASLPRLVGWLVSFSRDASGTDLRVREGRNQIGASEECELRIEGDTAVSGKHAVIMCRDGRLQIRDNDSVNGTYVDDEDVFGKGPVVLRDGSRIRLGSTEWTLHLIAKG